MKTPALSCFLLAFSMLVSAIVDASAAQPNIVIILSDDMGYGDLKAYNSKSKIPTPHLDRLAAEGMTFTDAHSGGSTCKPSRYALHSGEFAVRIKNPNDKKGPLLPEGQATVASMLRDNGYQTAMVGKWHLGFDQDESRADDSLSGFTFDPGKMTGGPRDRGFDSYFGMHASLDIPPYFFIQDRAATMAPTDRVEASDSVETEEDWNHIQGAFWREGAVAPDFKHIEVTPRFQKEACQVIENHEGEKPLFLYVALPSPHTPWLPTEEFAGKSGAGMYGDFVMQVDSVVGQVVASLEKAGMDEETLILFSSDNGPVWYEKDDERFEHASTGPLRGVKGSVWEGGHRVPFIVRWPNAVKAGVKIDHTVAFADVFATFAELAGQDGLPEGVAVDSASFAKVLLESDSDLKTRLPILHHKAVIRDGDWKLIDTKGGRGFGADKSVKYGVELYDLRNDLSEENNLADAMPEKVENLRGKIEKVLNDGSGNR